MNRVFMILLKNFWRVPGVLARLNRRIRSPEDYTELERIEPIQHLCKKVLVSGQISLEIAGQEHIPVEGGFIFYPNHQGIFDAVAIGFAVNRLVSPVVKKELMKYPLVRQLFCCADALPMDRKDIRQSMRVLQEVQQRVKAGKVCLIFPEGTRSREGNQLLEFKAGCFKPALKTHCPIVPVALVDSFKPFDTRITGPVMVHLHILKPLLWEEYQNMTTSEIAETVKQRIRSEMDEILSEKFTGCI